MAKFRNKERANVAISLMGRVAIPSSFMSDKTAQALCIRICPYFEGQHLIKLNYPYI